MKNESLELPALKPIQLDIVLGGGGSSQLFCFTQVPCRECGKIRLEGRSDSSPLSVSWEMDIPSGSLDMRLTISYSKASSAKVLYDSAKIYNAFFEGMGTINGQKIGEVNSAGDQRFSKSAIATFKMASELEGVLGVVFDLTCDLDQSGYNNLARLYCMLVLGKALWIPHKAESWTLPSPPDSREPPYSLTVILDHEETLELFGVSLTVYGYRQLVDAKVVEIRETDDGDVRLIFGHSETDSRNYAEIMTGLEPDGLSYQVPSYVVERFEDIRELSSLLKDCGLVD